MRPSRRWSLALAVLLVSAALPALTHATSVTLSVSEPSNIARTNDPITSGVPIDPLDVGLSWALFDGATEIPVQTTVLPGVKTPWLLLDFRATLTPLQTKTYQLVSQTPAVTLSPAIAITTSPTTETVVTGPMKVTINRLDFNLLEGVWIDADSDGKFKGYERIVQTTTNDNLPLTTADNLVKRGRGIPHTFTWEDLGAARATLRVDGRYGDPIVPTDTLLRYTTRITFHAGKSYVTVQHLIRNSVRAYERYVKVKSARLNLGSGGASGRIARSGDEVWLYAPAGNANLEMIPPKVTVTVDHTTVRVNGVFDVDSINGLVIGDWSYHGASARFDFSPGLNSGEQTRRTTEYVDRLIALAPSDWYSNRGAFGSEQFGTYDDEKNTSLGWGWTFPNVGSHACWSFEHNLPRPDATYQPSWSILSGTLDLEADDVWMHLMMYARVRQRTYFDRAERWARYMAWEFAFRTDGFNYQDNEYWNGPDKLVRPRQDLPAGTFTSVDNNYIAYNIQWHDGAYSSGRDDGGHTWNGGLVDFFYLTGDRDMLAAAIDIAEKSKKYWEYRSNTSLGGDIRSDARAYMNTLRVWEATSSPVWRSISSYLRNMFLYSNNYDTRGFYYYGPTSGYVGTTIPERYPNGKHLSPFMLGIVTQVLYREFVLSASADDSLGQRLEALASFFYQYGSQPDSNYTGDDMVMDSPNYGDVKHHSYSIFRTGTLPWQSFPSSSNSFIDAMTIGYRLTGNLCYLSRARDLWETSSKRANYPTPFYLYADDNHLGRFMNSLQCWNPQSIGYPDAGDLTYVQFFFRDADQADVTPPGAVTNLSAGLGYNYGAIAWTAAGDDGGTGQAQSQDLRYATYPLDESNFDSGIPISVGPPGPGGTSQCVDWTGFNHCTTYYFAIRTTDECHVSPISNVASAQSGCSPGLEQLCTMPQMSNGPALDEAIPLAVEFSAGANPAHGPTAIAFGVPRARAGEGLDIGIFDLAGRRVRTLERGPATPGRFRVEWDLRTDDGTIAHSGAYFLSLRIGPENHRRKLLIVR